MQIYVSLFSHISTSHNFLVFVQLGSLSGLILFIPLPALFKSTTSSGNFKPRGYDFDDCKIELFGVGRKLDTRHRCNG